MAKEDESPETYILKCVEMYPYPIGNLLKNVETSRFEPNNDKQLTAKLSCICCTYHSRWQTAGLSSSNFLTRFVNHRKKSTRIDSHRVAGENANCLFSENSIFEAIHWRNLPILDLYGITVKSFLSRIVRVRAS